MATEGAAGAGAGAAAVRCDGAPAFVIVAAPDGLRTTRVPEGVTGIAIAGGVCVACGFAGAGDAAVRATAVVVAGAGLITTAAALFGAVRTPWIGIDAPVFAEAAVAGGGVIAATFVFPAAGVVAVAATPVAVTLVVLPVDVTGAELVEASVARGRRWARLTG